MENLTPNTVVINDSSPTAQKQVAPANAADFATQLERRTKECETAKRLIDTLKGMREKDLAQINELKGKLQVQSPRQPLPAAAVNGAHSHAHSPEDVALKAKLDQAESLIAELEGEKAKFKSASDTLASVKEALASSQAECASLRAKAATTSQISANDVHQLQSKMDALTAKQSADLTAVQESASKYELEVRQLQSKMDALTAKHFTELKTAQESAARYEAEATDAKWKLEKERQDISKLNEKLSKIEKEHSAEIQQLETVAKSTIDKIQTKSDECEKLKANISQLIAELEEIRSAAAAESKKRDSQRHAVELAAKREHEDTIVALERQLKAALSRESSSIELNSDLNSKLKSSMKMERLLKEEIDTLIAQQSQAIDKISTANLAKEYADKVAKEMTEKTKISAQRVSALEKQLKDYEGRCDKISREFSQNQNKIKEVEANLKASHSRTREIDELSRKRATVVGIIAALLVFILMRVFG